MLRRLFEKQQLLAAGDPWHQTIRPLLIILWGTMRGVYGGGQVVALERFGLTHVFDTVVGVSTGTPIAAYFLAGQARIGTSIYCEECTTSDFMSVRELKIDVEYLADVFRGVRGTKALDQRAVRSSRSNFFAAVTNARTGAGMLVDVKEAQPDVVQAVTASIALPGFITPISLGDTRCLDGGGGLPFPLRLAAERFAATDVLVLANRPIRKKPIGHFVRAAATRWATAGLPSGVQEAYRTRHARFKAEVEARRSGRLPYTVSIIWTDDQVGPYEWRPTKLVAARDRADKHLSLLLEKARGPA